MDETGSFLDVTENYVYGSCLISINDHINSLLIVFGTNGLVTPFYTVKNINIETYEIKETNVP